MELCQVTLFDHDALHSQKTQAALEKIGAANPQLVLVFGSKAFFAQDAFLPLLHRHIPAQTLAGCSTAGEISGVEVNDQSCVITAISFAKTKIRICEAPIDSNAGSFEAGRHLGEALVPDEAGHRLAAVLLFGRGTEVNGSALIEGLHHVTRADLPISGGLAGDDGAFEQTYTLAPSGISSTQVIAIGLYGDHLGLSFGSAGGWEAFGPTRRITGCDGNVLHSLDGEPALDIYKRYLGDYAKDLPSSGLLFPFELVSQEGQSAGLIRTILGIDESTGSLILAGSVDPNGYLRLMHSNTDKLIDGAESAATKTGIVTNSDTHRNGPCLAVLVSCVGRKLVMGDRIDEEVEAVNDLLTSSLGYAPTQTGFYSYGEINPHGTGKICHLHNQTMTIALISEKRS